MFAQNKNVLVPQTESLPGEVVRINHEVFSDLLKKYVNKQGLFSYKDLKRNKEDLESLESYIQDLLLMNPNLLSDAAEMKSAWLNLYNAIVIFEIVKKYPVSGVLNIPAFFAEPKYKIEDKVYSLLDIEKGIFHDRIKDSRMAFARCFGAIGAPNLIPEAYDAKKLDKQLDEAVLSFIKSPYNVIWDPKKKRLMVSSLLLWHKEEIGDTEAFFRVFQPSLPVKLGVFYLPFAWQLNENK